jgi:hypothetical protein
MMFVCSDAMFSEVVSPFARPSSDVLHRGKMNRLAETTATKHGECRRSSCKIMVKGSLVDVATVQVDELVVTTA